MKQLLEQLDSHAARDLVSLLGLSVCLALVLEEFWSRYQRRRHLEALRAASQEEDDDE